MTTSVGTIVPAGTDSTDVEASVTTSVGTIVPVVIDSTDIAEG